MEMTTKSSKIPKWLPLQIEVAKQCKYTGYRRRTNFHGHNISWVKFSRGQIFVGGGSPRKFNPHEKLFTSSTRDRNGAA